LQSSNFLMRSERGLVYGRWRGLRTMSAIDAVDGSSTGT
jgi:hypothetical protein